jgi:hypothetical protein
MVSVFDEEHRSLDHTLADVEFLAERRSFQSAAKRFGELRRGIERHLHAEETVLFPAFKERTKDPKKLLPFIEAQHRLIREGLDAVGAALSCSDYNAFCEELSYLAGLLRHHEADEKQLLQPDMEAPLKTDAEWASFVDATQRRAAAH